MFFDLSGKIDEGTVEALYEIRKVADTLGVAFFVVGASARDIILKHCYGIDPPRMTRDVDLGVEVASWDLFERLVRCLISTGKFVTTKDKHRLKFGLLPVDIVPFGRITDDQQRISWPPEHEIIMSLVGFADAYEHAITIRLMAEPLLEVKIPSLAGLAIMKLVAWEDGYPERRKDAQDLILIMHRYEYAGNYERLYNEDEELLRAEEFDTRLAGIRLLGRDMALIAGDETAEVIRRILNAETNDEAESKLIIDMLRSDTLRYEGLYDEIKIQIEKLQKGFAESARNVQR